jgi:methylated-DNA-[protein]-cysteine S-methyltransferase
LRGILWDKDLEDPKIEKLWSLVPQRETEISKQTKQQLTEYLQGERNIFQLPLDPEGTEFQKEVWLALQKIPFGQTWSYKDQAIAMGSALKVRAVATANGSNPISVVVPCHRVLGSDGALRGFAGGLEWKKRLIDLESSRIEIKAVL